MRNLVLTFKKTCLENRMMIVDTPFVKELESHFVSTEDFAASYSFIIEGIKKPLYVAIQNGELDAVQKIIFR